MHNVVKPALPTRASVLFSGYARWRALLIVGYIVAVLLFSGLARADQGLLDGVVSIFGF